jgi:hypothetical protein
MVTLYSLLLWLFIALALVVTFGVLYYLEHKKTPCVPPGCPECDNLTKCHPFACTANALTDTINSDRTAKTSITKDVVLQRTSELVADTAVLDAIVAHPTIINKLTCPPGEKGPASRKSNKTLLIVLLVIGGLILVGGIVFFLVRKANRDAGSPVRPPPRRSRMDAESPVRPAAPFVQVDPGDEEVYAAPDAGDEEVIYSAPPVRLSASSSQRDVQSFVRPEFSGQINLSPDRHPSPVQPSPTSPLVFRHHSPDRHPSPTFADLEQRLQRLQENNMDVFHLSPQPRIPSPDVRDVWHEAQERNRAMDNARDVQRRVTETARRNKEARRQLRSRK